MMLGIFSCTFGYFFIFSGEMFFQMYFLFFSWIAFYYWVVSALYIKSLVIYMICRYFLSLCELFSQFLDGGLRSSKFLIFMRFNLSFSFVTLAFETIFKNVLPDLRSWRFILMIFFLRVLSFNSYILAFNIQLLHLALTCSVCGVR